MGGGGEQKTNTVAEPPKFLRPFLKDAAMQSQQLYQTGGRQFFPDSTVTSFSDPTVKALFGTGARAQLGGAASNAAQGYAQQAIGGSFLDSNPFANGSEQNPFAAGGANPFLDQTFDRAANSVQQRLQSGFAGAGRDISAGRPVAAQELNDLATNIYGGAYENDATRRQAAYEATQGRRFAGFENERKAQDYAASIAPMLDSTDYQDLDALRGVGAQVDQQNRAFLDDRIARFEFDQNRPYQNLDEYIARLNGAYPGQSQTMTSSGGQNRAAGALGGAALGAGVGSSLAAGAKAGSILGPYGTAIGAGVGLLGGYFLS